MNKNIKNIIDSRLENLCVSSSLEEKILHSISVPKKSTRRPFTVAVCVCMCLILAIPILAATIPSFNALLFRVGSEIGGQLQPVNLICEDNGIKMEVVAAMNDDDTVITYLTLQDLTGSRIDESLELFRYYVKCEGEYLSASPEIVAYDKSTNTATIRLQSNAAGTNIGTLNGKKITVVVDSFISRKQEFDDFDVGINLKDITDTTNTVTLDINGFSKGASSTELLAELEQQKKINILKPDELHIPLAGIDFAYISNIGIVDGRLHVQIRNDYSTESMRIGGYTALVANSFDVVDGKADYFTVDWDNDIHIGRVDLNFETDKKGNIINNGEYIEKYEDGKVYSKYTEIIFDANPDILMDCTLIGKYFSAYRNYTVGNWQTTFEVNSVNESKSAACDIDLGGIRLNSISVSPFGVIAYGDADESYKVDISVNITMTDGSIENYGTATLEKTINADGNNSQSFSSIEANPNVTSSTNYGENGEFSMKYICNIPLDIGEVESVIINGEVISLKN